MKNPLPLNDYLAIRRSELANDRTFLAFLRTALMFFVSGITMIKIFAGNQSLTVLAYLLLPLSGVVFIWGIVYYLKIRKDFSRHYDLDD